MDYVELFERFREDTGIYDIELFDNALALAFPFVDNLRNGRYSAEDLQEVIPYAYLKSPFFPKEKEEGEDIIFSAYRGAWFRASSYTVGRDGWVKAARGSRVDYYSLDDEIETVIDDLVGLVAVLREEGLSFKSKRVLSNLVEFYQQHGPLGLAFQGVYGISMSWSSSGFNGPVVYLDPLRTQRKPAVEYFENYLQQPERCFNEKGFNAKRFSSEYREHYHSALTAAVMFNPAYKAYTTNNKQGMIDFFQHALNAASSRLQLDGSGRLVVAWRATGLLNRCYLHLLNKQLGGPAGKICADPKCGKHFIPERRNKQYCSERCYERVRKARERAALKKG